MDAGNDHYASIDGVLFDKAAATLVRFPAGKSASSYAVPSGVTSIPEYAFFECSSLQSLSLPSSVENIDVTAFFYCTSLNGIQVDAANSHYASIDGILFDEAISTLLCYPVGMSGASYVIPSSVTILGEFAFHRVTSLTGVILPASLTTINYCAFVGCSGLTGIFIPSSVATVARFAFSGCWFLSICCQAPSKPAGWHDDWNYRDSTSVCPVTWSCTP